MKFHEGHPPLADRAMLAPESSISEAVRLSDFPPISTGARRSAGAESLVERSQKARARARRAQEAMLAAHEGARRAASAGSRPRQAKDSVEELKGCLKELRSTARLLEKALADVGRETGRVTRLLGRAEMGAAPQARRVLRFHR